MEERTCNGTQDEAKVADGIHEGKIQEKVVRRMLATGPVADEGNAREKRHIGDIGKHHPFRQARTDESLKDDNKVRAREATLQQDELIVQPPFDNHVLEARNSLKEI
jgi:hypothetical protein